MIHFEAIILQDVSDACDSYGFVSRSLLLIQMLPHFTYFLIGGYISHSQYHKNVHMYAANRLCTTEHLCDCAICDGFHCSRPWC